MAVPTNKEELQYAIETNYTKLKKELSAIPQDRCAVLDLPGHAKETSMSINNLLSYLIGWGELVLKWNERKDGDLPVDFPETGYKWNELGRLAQKFYKDYERLDFNALCKLLDTTVAKILDLIGRKSDHELYAVTWYDKWTLGRMIQFNTASPYLNAKGRIRKWKKEHQLK